ncbi:hypothetical protein AB0D08_30205 [Kitasatospora sp. NPDC048540]|uniref:hypothetical protein n=1 Tax=Kitasatospora sp. NPDC048540 TaxID=3155634 RepID=UPI0033D9BC22
MTIDPNAIRNGFALVEPHGAEVAAYFYRHLFEHSPALRPLVAVDLDERQVRRWAALGGMVTRSEDTEAPAGLVGELVRELAPRPEHRAAVAAGLLATLEHFAGDARTPGAESARAAVRDVIDESTGAAAARPAGPSPSAR